MLHSPARGLGAQRGQIEGGESLPCQGPGQGPVSMSMVRDSCLASSSRLCGICSQHRLVWAWALISYRTLLVTSCLTLVLPSKPDTVLCGVSWQEARLEFRDQAQCQSQMSSHTAVLPTNNTMGLIKDWVFSSSGSES